MLTSLERADARLGDVQASLRYLCEAYVALAGHAVTKTDKVRSHTAFTCPSLLGVGVLSAVSAPALLWWCRPAGQADRAAAHSFSVSVTDAAAQQPHVVGLTGAVRLVAVPADAVVVCWPAGGRVVPRAAAVHARRYLHRVPAAVHDSVAGVRPARASVQVRCRGACNRHGPEHAKGTETVKEGANARIPCLPVQLSLLDAVRLRVVFAS